VSAGRHVAHVAVLAGRPVGLVRWIRWRDPGPAEIAYEVADAAQRRGIGAQLLSRVGRSAAAAGIEHFLAAGRR
jgi:GNAT superfamily N-acetyltransferase